MTIRPALPADRDAVVALVHLAIHDIAHQLTGERTDEAARAQLARYYSEPGNRFSRDRCLVKSVEGAVAGMVLCYRGSEADALYAPVLRHLRERSDDGATAIDREADPDEFYIDAVAVFPAFEGRGFAKELIAAAERWAAEAGERKIALNVDLANGKAHAIYRRLGYAEDKRLTINGHPFRHMIKRL